MDDITRVLTFWFGAAPAATEQEARVKLRRWFQGGPTMDAEVREQFGPLVEKALRGDLASWAETPRGRLALILVLDQLTRNLWRNEARCYSGDQAAQRLSVEAYDAGVEKELSLEERLFLRMPLSHSEDLTLQERSARESDELVAAAPASLRPVYAMGREQSHKYRDIIARFGRFPHRNEVLGRASTPEEVEFLKDWAERAPPSGMRPQPSF
jgi:uncharacterized protein (DUF924 family)